MRNMYLALIGMLMSITSCQTQKEEKQEISIQKQQEQITPFEEGKRIFKGKGKCYTCHMSDKKLIGPSIVEMVKVYAEKDADLVAFMKQQSEPIVDPENYAVMRTNFAILKTFSDKELKSLETYMIGIAKGKK